MRHQAVKCAQQWGCEKSSIRRTALGQQAGTRERGSEGQSTTSLTKEVVQEVRAPNVNDVLCTRLHPNEW